MIIIVTTVMIIFNSSSCVFTSVLYCVIISNNYGYTCVIINIIFATTTMTITIIITGVVIIIVMLYIYIYMYTHSMLKLLVVCRRGSPVMLRRTSYRALPS